MKNNNFKFPDTGQIKCFDTNSIEIKQPQKGEDLFGQNSCFKVHPMSFSKLNFHGIELSDSDSWETGFRMIKDNNTGLIWEIKSPNEKDINYVENTYSWEEAQTKYIDQLNTSNYGGYSDWRAPQKEELRTIIDYSTSSPSIDPLYFPYTKTGMYWCKEKYEMQPNFAWVLFFGVGSATAANISSKRYVRAVRGGNTIQNRLVDNGDGTITDTLTNLMWQKGENPRMNWFEALKYAQSQNIAGYNDWRLPNIKELNSILNLAYTDGWWYYKDLFPAEGLTPPLLHYFSSTVYEKYFVWVTNFCFGYDGYYANKNSALLFRLVRNIEVQDVTENEFALPETGQDICYNTIGNEIPKPQINEPLYGQDGSYKKNPFSYIALRDNSILVDSYSNKMVSMIKDTNTGLVWEFKSTDKLALNYNAYKCTWNEASDYIDMLNKTEYGGYKDWRLPNKEELRSIVNYNDVIPAVNKDVFSTILPDFYWSKDSFGADDKLAWGIYFGYGCGICYMKESKFHVIAVREGYNTSFGNVLAINSIDNNDGTISDFSTGLMWKKDESPDLGFEDALMYCENLDLAGYTDWRLPNIREIATLIDSSFKDGTWFNQKLFPNVKTKPLGFYWSSTTFAATFGWGVNFQFGYDGYYADKINGKYPFRPVRNI